MEKYYVVLNTCPDMETAQAIADKLVSARLAACVNIIPGISSVYQWQGQCRHDSEWLLIIKTRAETYKSLETAIRPLHPYEVPEIIALPASDGLPAYLSWIDEQTCPDQSHNGDKTQ